MLRSIPIALVAALVLACGSAAPTPPARPVPSGPPRTFLHAPHAFLLRVDCASIAATPLAPAVSELWRASPLFEGFAGAASLDPVHDLDAMVATTASVSRWHGGPAASRWRVVLRHHEEPAAARTLLARIASAHGETLAWRESQGIVSAALPGELGSSVPHVIVLTARHEAVLAPDDERAEIAAVARDHAARRASDDEAIEPGLAAPEGELVRAETTSPPPFLASLGASAARASVVRRGQGATVRLELDFPTAALATEVARTATEQLASLATNGLVVAMGLAHPLATARVTTTETTVVVETDATFAELESALRALAMVSASQ